MSMDGDGCTILVQARGGSVPRREQQRAGYIDGGHGRGRHSCGRRVCRHDYARPCLANPCTPYRDRWKSRAPFVFRSGRILGISRALCTLNSFSTGTLVTVRPDLLRRRFSTGRKSPIRGTLGLTRADRQPRASRAGASASRRARSANQRSLFRMPPYTMWGPLPAEVSALQWTPGTAGGDPQAVNAEPRRGPPSAPP